MQSAFSVFVHWMSVGSWFSASFLSGLRSEMRPNHISTQLLIGGTNAHVSVFVRYGTVTENKGHSLGQVCPYPTAEDELY